jgi:alpha-mannosidase
MTFPDGCKLVVPQLQIIDDPTDTWSHDIDRYGEWPESLATWSSAQVEDTGPIMGSVIKKGRIGSSPLSAEWRVYAGEPFVEMRLHVDWMEAHKVLKLVLELPSRSDGRVDGVLGGSLARENDGRERPVRDWTLIGGVGIVSPHTYALDASAGRVRLTLLRSPTMAHHAPWTIRHPRAPISDHGPHDFVFRFFCGEGADEGTLDRHALMLQRPLILADLTTGMPAKKGQL